MIVIIPAAGQGTRLRPHTHTLPKVMLPVAGRPIIGHILADVAGLDPAEVRIVVGYRGEAVERYVREEFPHLPTRCVWQHERLGLGHAVLQALSEGESDSALIVLGDTVFDVEYADVVGFEKNVLGVRSVPDPERFGVVQIDPRESLVTKVVEKPTEPIGNLALVGLYFIHDASTLRKAIENLVDGGETTRGEYQLTDALQGMIDDGYPFVPYEIGGWYDCGTQETLLSTNRVLLERLNPGRPSVAEPHGTVYIAPVCLGDGCVVENSVVGPFVSMGENVILRDAIVRDSILAAGSVVEGAVLERSIVGPGSRVRGRARTINLGEDSEVEW